MNHLFQPISNWFPRKSFDSLPISSLAPTTSTVEAKVPNQAAIAASATCHVLGVLERQLSEVAADVENSVTGVSLGFQGMASRAQAVVQTASQAIGGRVNNRGGIELIEEMHTVLGALIEHIELSRTFSESTSAKLSGLETRLAAVETILNDVEELASQSKLVALNGQIEAARLGQAGLPFAVVAEETKSLSANAAKTSDLIRKQVCELADELKATSAEIKVRAAQDSTRFSEFEHQSRNLLQDIDTSQQQMSASLSSMGEISGELQKDISHAVMSMQFQDRVNQQLAHISESLTLLAHKIEPELKPHEQQLANECCSEWLQVIASRSTMESERVALSGNGADSMSAASNDEFSVELF